MYYKCGVVTKLEAIEAAMRVSRRILHIFHCDTCDSFLLLLSSCASPPTRLFQDRLRLQLD